VKVPLSWLGRSVDLTGIEPAQIARRLTAAGLQVERVEHAGEDISGVVVARVVDIEELSGFKKPIRWATLDDGDGPRQVICGATNFAVDDLVAYARPPAALPGGVRIERRPAYDHISDGMICSARELGVGDDHTGIVVLGSSADPGSFRLGTDIVDALSLRDVVLEIAVNPDRGYALSVRGVAREVSTAFGRAFDDPGLLDIGDLPAAPGPSVHIDDPAGCDRYVLRCLVGLDPAAPSPPWLRRQISLAGMRPISLTVDVTNHVMLGLGQPLHAFDATKVAGDIVVRRAAAGERLRTLDGVDRKLHPDDLVIADDSGPIALAGVMGGQRTEIGPGTTSILIESAHFDPVSVAYTARRHRLGSEASRRFERGVDLDLQPAAAESAARLLQTLGGAQDSTAQVDVDHRTPVPPISLPADLPARLTGLPVGTARVLELLGAVGCRSEDREVPGALQVTPPPWRPDLQRAVDLVEEVARLEGYDRLPVTVPRAPAGRGLTRSQRRRRHISRAVAAAGYVEVLTAPFVSASAADALGLADSDPARPVLRLANPISDESPFLRASLLPGLLDALVRNLRRGANDLAIYEEGPVFRRRAHPAAMPRLAAATRPTADQLAELEAALPEQPRHLATVNAGRWELPGWWGSGRSAGWQDAVTAARVAAEAIGGRLTVSAADGPGPWHPGRCAVLSAGDAAIGWAGELHPRVVAAWDLPSRTCAMELDLDRLIAAAPDLPMAATVSAYPAASFDVAVVVAGDVPVADVSAALAAGAGPLLESIRLFDVYRGDQLAAGEVSYAFAMRLRAADRTLTAAELTAARDEAVAMAESRTGAKLRT
jgi:phenylalanyl-tRNA synthetase beta chain